MKYGVFAGITWALDTVILGVALSMPFFSSDYEMVILAPFISTFFHDAASAMWALIFNIIRGNLKNILDCLKTKDGGLIATAALIGGPIGMSGYVLSVNYMGPSIGAIASACFPAIGAFLAFIFLKEKMSPIRWIFLIITLAGVLGLSYSPGLFIKSYIIGLIGTLMCSFGWGVEAVILAKCLKNSQIKDEYALFIRQATSALAYGLIILPIIMLVRESSFQAMSNIPVNTALIIVLAAVFGTISYLFYYKAISLIGASKAMALDVSYCAWAVIFSVIIFRDLNIINPITIICLITVLGGGIIVGSPQYTGIKKKL